MDSDLSAPPAEPSIAAVTNTALVVQTSKPAPVLASGPRAVSANPATPETSPESTLAAPGAAEPNPANATNETLSGGAEFMRKSLASPFAQAAQALKESYDSALIAVQIGDYERAVTELIALVESSDLTAEQEQAVRDLLEEALTAAPELAPSPGAGATNGVVP